MEQTVEMEDGHSEAELATARQKFESYIFHTNQVLGVSAFGTALGCAGLKLPSLFAFFGLAFTLLVWWDAAKSSAPYIDVLRKYGDDSARPWAILLRCKVAVIGWLFLGLVAIDLVHA